MRSLNRRRNGHSRTNGQQGRPNKPSGLKSSKKAISSAMKNKRKVDHRYYRNITRMSHSFYDAASAESRNSYFYEPTKLNYDDRRVSVESKSSTVIA